MPTATSPAPERTHRNQIDLEREKPLTLAEAAKLPMLARNGRAPHIASLFRWANPGVLDVNGGRVRLEVLQLAGSKVTTKEAVLRFINRLTNPDSATDEPTQIERNRSHRLADVRMTAVLGA